MANGFEIEIKGLNTLVKQIEKYPAISEKHINKAINRSLIKVQDKAKKNAPSGDTQQLRQNWILQMGRFKGSLTSGAKNKGFSYGLAVEFGTRPHIISVKNNPMFQLWATRRGLNPYAVAKTIAKKGTKAQPFFQQSVNQSERFVNNEFDKALEAIIKEI